jgi:hypothetical protein
MPKNEIHLVVQTLSGTFEGDFNIHQKLQQVVDTAFRALHIEPSPGDQWELRYRDTVLALDHSIQDAGLPDGAVLKLAPKEGGGGR